MENLKLACKYTNYRYFQYLIRLIWNGNKFAQVCMDRLTVDHFDHLITRIMLNFTMKRDSDRILHELIEIRKKII